MLSLTTLRIRQEIGKNRTLMWRINNVDDRMQPCGLSRSGYTHLDTAVKDFYPKAEYAGGLSSASS